MKDTDWQARLEAIRRAIARQDAAMAIVREKVSAFGEVRVFVPREQLEAIEAAARREAPAARHVAGIRG
jgi:hypothetical protein